MHNIWKSTLRKSQYFSVFSLFDLNTLTFGCKEKVNELNLNLNDVSKYVRDSKCNVVYTLKLNFLTKLLTLLNLIIM